ncbi:MAG: hypothetical protein DHS20C06_20470 [Hyphobacterium sp.]|nr:MAG: hypothetical protein DHS20C06_20470 [Hyphobacterium sp.]
MHIALIHANIAMRVRDYRAGETDMKRFLMVVMAATGLTACATTSPGGDLASSAFDYEPARVAELPDHHFGYEMTGDDGWEGSMVYEASGRTINVDFNLAGNGLAATADLAIEDPYLNEGVRRFIGQTAAGDDVFVLLQAGPCNGGEASYFATLVIGSTRLNGCASEHAANDRWSNYLADWMPAIDLCVAELSSRADHVTFAYSTASGTAVRLADNSGNRWECNTVDDRRVNAIAPLTAVDVRLGEADPIFVRSQMPTQGDACYVYESVRDASGVLIGAFGYDSCAGPRAPVS